jgi:hypothetical protein
LRRSAEIADNPGVDDVMRLVDLGDVSGGLVKFGIDHAGLRPS